MSNGSELVQQISDAAEGLAYRSRLINFDKRKRALIKNTILNQDGFFTIQGAMIFCDRLAKKYPELLNELADDFIEADKEEKKLKK